MSIAHIFNFSIIVDIKYYMFHVYTIVVRHLYNLWSDTLKKSSTHLMVWLQHLISFLGKGRPQFLVTLGPLSDL